MSNIDLVEDRLYMVQQNIHLNCLITKNYVK